MGSVINQITSQLINTENIIINAEVDDDVLEDVKYNTTMFKHILGRYNKKQLSLV